MSKRELVDLPCILKHETERAYLFDFGELAPVWIAKSQCEYRKEGRNEICTMPEWLALEKDLI